MLLRLGSHHLLGNHLWGRHRVDSARNGRDRVRGRLGGGSVGKRRVVGLLCLGELLEQRLARVEFKRQSRLADGNRRGLLAHLLPLQVAFQRVEEESVMWHAVPVKDLLLLLRADAVVLVQEVEERALWLLERSISTRLEVSQVGEDSLFKLFRVLDGSAKGLEAE